ncbi:hypothetical protein [Sanguibacter sp. 25GB23B1]|uniref:hypothetical protein n=1 Tax=unclassified Sanguibacter TaxID=2645534 RepID=UPI0032AEBE9A
MHGPVFDALVSVADPSATSVSLVRPGLLDRARADAPDSELRSAVRSAVAELAAAGAQVVVCTCSTIGSLAEAVGLTEGIPVLRVDRPMADRAVRTPPGHPGAPVRVLVAVALGSTLGPTTALLTASAEAAGREISIGVLRCDSAWPLFEAGRPMEFAAAVAEHVAAAVVPSNPAEAPRADVVVLAQASMAPAAELLAGLGVPVLASPREAVRRALDLAGGAEPREPAGPGRASSLSG